MLNRLQRKIVQHWANDVPMYGGQPISLDKLLGIGDSLKDIAKGKSLAIIAPSHLMREISKTKEYNDLINSSSIDKMTVNKGIFLPGIEKYQWYLPLTVRGPTYSINKDLNYVDLINKFTGVVMHGMYVKDSVNSYMLASPKEIKYLIKQCPNTEFTIWTHQWSEYLRKGTMVHRMCEFPYYDQWTPARLPWAHCGAISGFAIPMAMALGYTKIYLLCMGYDYVLNSCIDPPGTPIMPQSTCPDQRGVWIGVAPMRFKNQAALAKAHGITIKVGPKAITEDELFKYFESFDKIEDIING